jgi:mRNA-degrading endonuclease toxin of MazEF toxin-antitoxin module
MARQYVPDAGDVVWISFNQQARRAKRKGRISDAELAELRGELRALSG